MDSQGLKSHRNDFEFKEIVDIWIKWTAATYEYKNAFDAHSSVSLSEVQLQNRLSELKDVLVSIGKRLGSLLFAPLEPLLEPGGELVIVPDSLLRVLPLHLASFEKEGHLRYVTDLYDIIYCEFVDTANLGPASAKRNIPARISVLSFSPPEAPLPFSHFESIAIANTTDPMYLKQKFGPEATVESLVESIRTTEIVHLCCHGNYFLNSPLNSSLSLADSTVSERELQLRLHSLPCWLIVLSACESGIREAWRSDEGAGFPGTLLTAGCQNVVSTLRRVKDISTAFLMGEFYNELAQGAPLPHFALCRAQRWLSKQSGRALVSTATELLAKYEKKLDPAHRLEIETGLKDLSDSENIRPFEHPLYWGAFFTIEEKVSLVSKTQS
jgi:CHAT domain-containing protein